MSVPTKMPRTDHFVKVILYGPKGQKDECIAAAKQFGFCEYPETVPALEALSQYVNQEEIPNIALRVHRENANLTQKELAEKVGIRQHHISEIENKKRTIGKELAQKIAKVLKTDYRSYL